MGGGHDHGPGGHRHGTIDPGVRASSAGLRATVWSLVILGVTAALQAVVVVASGSVALLADTVHNASDALTAVPLGAAFLLARRPPTDRFTYGLRRAEDLAGLLVVLAIAASAVVVLYEAVLRLSDPRTPSALGWVALAGVAGAAGNLGAALLRTRVGRRIGSAALVADGRHAHADTLTSLAVVAGAAGAAAGLPLADPIVGLVIGLAILRVAWQAAREVGERMLDGVDPGIVRGIRKAAGAVGGVVEVDEVRARWLGHEVFCEVNVAVDDDLTVAEGHEIARHVQHALTHHVPHLGTVVVHVDPSAAPGERHHPLHHHHHHHV